MLDDFETRGLFVGRKVRTPRLSKVVGPRQVCVKHLLHELGALPPMLRDFARESVRVGCEMRTAIDGLDPHIKRVTALGEVEALGVGEVVRGGVKERTSNDFVLTQKCVLLHAGLTRAVVERKEIELAIRRVRVEIHREALRVVDKRTDQLGIHGILGAEAIRFGVLLHGVFRRLGPRVAVPPRPVHIATHVGTRDATRKVDAVDVIQVPGGVLRHVR